MTYTPPTFANGGPPAINATNLAAMALAAGNTGARDVKSLISGYSTLTAAILTRVGHLVTLQLQALTMASATQAQIGTLPAGFRPSGWINIAMIEVAGTTVAKLAVGAGGEVVVRGTTPGSQWEGTILWITTDPWPATLP